MLVQPFAVISHSMTVHSPQATNDRSTSGRSFAALLGMKRTLLDEMIHMQVPMNITGIGRSMDMAQWPEPYRGGKMGALARGFGNGSWCRRVTGANPVLDVVSDGVQNLPRNRSFTGMLKKIITRTFAGPGCSSPPAIRAGSDVLVDGIGIHRDLSLIGFLHG